jgi:acylphosphatase
MASWEMNAVGRVQGVGFRWFVKDCAQEYRINGYVKNLADGSVKILAEGDLVSLELFANAIRQGNGHAVIRQLSVAEVITNTDYKDFFIA